MPRADTLVRGRRTRNDDHEVAVDPALAPSPLGREAAVSEGSQRSLGNAVVGAAVAGADLDGLGRSVEASLMGAITGAPTTWDEAVGSNLAMLRRMRAARAEGDEVRIPTGGGRGLPAAVKERFERAFGRSLDDVRIHTDASASRAAEGLSAHAFAVGHDLYFGPGEFAPGTPDGDRLLAHELTHVVQHEDGRLPSDAGVSSPTDPAEQEAYANEDRILGHLGAKLPDATAPAEASASTSTASAVEPAMRSPDEEEEEEDEDESWLISLVRQISPELADVLDQGVVGAFQDDLTDAVDVWLAETIGDIQVETFASDVAARIGGAAGIFVGASLGDQACCETFEAWLGSFTEGATAFVDTGSPLAQLADAVAGGVSGVLARFGELLDGIGVMEALGAAVDGIAETVDGLLEMVRSVNQTLGDQAAAWLGVESSEDGLVGLVGELIEEAFAEIGAQIQRVRNGWTSEDFHLVSRRGWRPTTSTRPPSRTRS